VVKVSSLSDQNEDVWTLLEAENAEICKNCSVNVQLQAEKGPQNPIQSQSRRETAEGNLVVSGSAIDHQNLCASQASEKPQNLLMCTHAKVQFGQWPPMLAQVFLDPGSQRNLISTDFVRRIGSKPFKFENVKMAGFDAIPKSRNAGIHKLKLHGFYDQDFELELIELENIVGNISFVSNPYHPAIDDEVLPADSLTRASPDILIGIKDYMRLKVAQKEILPSGFTRMRSLLGDLIAGEGKLTKRGFLSNENQIVTPAVTVQVPEEDIIVPQQPILQGRSACEEVINNSQHFTINSRGRLSLADHPHAPYGTAQRFRALQSHETVQTKVNRKQVKHKPITDAPSFIEWYAQRCHEKNPEPVTTTASMKTTNDGTWSSNLVPFRKKVPRTSGK
jgi:hypothetical protein